MKLINATHFWGFQGSKGSNKKPNCQICRETKWINLVKDGVSGRIRLLCRSGQVQ